ncbi:MAG: hypothetical protein HKN44_04875 [Ilumatobacter sp.]|nr:hypothetical protein [Ilumatobacter sp.]
MALADTSTATTDGVPATTAPPSSDVVVTTRITEPPVADVETRHQIGPRAIDVDRAMMLVVDSIDTSGDDIFIRVSVVTLGDEAVDVGVDDAIYGPLLELRDDLGNRYPARAVEPAGVYGHSVGRFDLRLEGPFDPAGTELTVELATQRGLLTTAPVEALAGDAVQWWSESPPVSFAEPVVGSLDDRTVEVLEVVDRGTHLDVSFRASAPSSGFAPGDVRATLTLSDGTELTAIPPDVDAAAAAQPRAMSGVLRFPGTLPIESEAVLLSIAGIDIQIPAVPHGSTAAEPPVAGLPQLPGLIHAKIFNDPLPPSSVTFDDA